MTDKMRRSGIMLRECTPIMVLGVEVSLAHDRRRVRILERIEDWLLAAMDDGDGPPPAYS